MISNPDNVYENLDIEIKLFLEAIFLKYGYDFRNYSKAHLKRRILHRLNLTDVESISEMQYKVLHEPLFMKEVLKDFSINVTEMFRDPDFYLSLRNEVVPILRTYPFIKIWHAGCSTGEEVYSMAILLEEEGLLERTQIYATDYNHQVLEKAKAAIYSLDNIKEFQMNYQKSGGKRTLAEYYQKQEENFKFADYLRKRIVFSDHNLVLDNVFAEVHMVVCRNVLIYFNRELQSRVIKLFHESIITGGILALGNKETLDYSQFADAFEPLNKKQKIYLKKYSYNY
ncbi:MAG TPA: protein-glutamate O-methyltransferase CheR [Bacteroidales bacterium]|nr:protein-glutamate O-methyltransferase CheR [Bacteroidales bacterium]